jgi:hypothetical protein
MATKSMNRFGLFDNQNDIKETKMIRAICIAVMLLLPGLATAQKSPSTIDFCLAKDDKWNGEKHREQISEYGFDCAVVYWKLSSADNRADPYSWVHAQYQDKNVPVVMTLIIDHGQSTVGTSEGTDVAGGVPGLLYQVISGFFDEDLRALAQAIKKDGRPVTIRPFHELDGDWYPWGMYEKPPAVPALAENASTLERELFTVRKQLNAMTSNSPILAVGAMAHVIRLFEVEQVENVSWEVNFNRRDGKGAVLGDAEYLIPQLEAIGVDAFSVSTYNRCGSNNKYTEQLSFADEFMPIYERLVALTDKPIRVAETSTTDFCAPKADWFKQMATDLKYLFPKVDMVTLLFGVVKVGKASNDVEIDWSCGGDQECIDALKNLLSDNAVQSSIRPHVRPEQ